MTARRWTYIGALLLVSCGQGTEVQVVVPTATTLLISPSSLDMSPGEEVQLQATVLDQNGATMMNAAVSWRSTNQAAVTVTQQGLVRAVSAGTSEVHAASGTVDEFVPVSVVDTQNPPALAEECRASAPEWIWCDDFDQDRLASYFERSNPNGSFQRVSGVGAAGSWGMRARWTTAQVDAGALRLAFGRTPDAYIAPVDGGTRDYREVYWRVYVFNEPGWTGGGGEKMSRATSLVTANWAQSMIAHVWSPQNAPDYDYLLIDPASGTDPSGNLRTTQYNDFANLRWPGSRRGVTPLFRAGNVGRWYCVEAHVKLNDAGSSNGVFELWIDGAVEARRTDLNWVGSYAAYGINAIFLENYWNLGSPAAQQRIFDNFVVSTARIGCVSP